MRAVISVFSIIASLIVFATNASNAQTAKTRRYCNPPETFLANAEKIISVVQAKCQKGDILEFDGNATFAVVKLCDFDRTIYRDQTMVACIYDGVHPGP